MRSRQEETLAAVAACDRWQMADGSVPDARWQMDDGRWQCQAAHCEHPSLFTMYTLYLVGQRGCFVLEDACFVLEDAYTQRECLFSKTGCGTVCVS